MALKLGIIGYGGMATGWHQPNCEKVSGIEVVAAYDINPERVALAESKGLTGYHTLNEFLADERVNTVLVATPNDFHCEMVCAALNAGKNAISEKPVTLSVELLDKMIEASKKAGKIFTVHHNRRWDTDFVRAKSVFESGKLGNVYAIKSQGSGTHGAMYGWRSEPEHGGGMLYDWGIHFLDQIYYMLGYDELLSVKCSLKSVRTPLVDDYFSMMITTRGGINVVVENGTFILEKPPRWTIMGDMGTLRIDDYEGNGEIILAVDKQGNKTCEPVPELKPQWAEFYENLRDALDGKAELAVQPWQVRKVLHLVECAFESAATGKQIEL